MIKTVTKLSSEYNDFVDNYESRKLLKKKTLIEAGEKLQKKLRKNGNLLEDGRNTLTS